MLCIAVAGLAAGIERLLRKPEAELTSVDRTLAYVFVGRYFARLRQRGYLLSAWGWRALLALLAAIGLFALLAR